jgi:hypothetical protein
MSKLIREIAFTSKLILILVPVCVLYDYLSRQSMSNIMVSDECSFIIFNLTISVLPVVLSLTKEELLLHKK